jgi:RNA polymerase sigma factor (sigma-70 family)
VEVSVEMLGDLESASDFGLLRLSHSNHEAFAAFYRRYEALVVGWLVHQTGSPELAADLTAEVFAAAYLASGRYREGPEPAGAWLLGIARNKLLKSWRRDRTEVSACRRLAVERIAVSDETVEVIERLSERRLVDLLAELPEDQRDAVRARVIEELDYEEFRAVAGLSAQAARKRVSRGLAALRRKVEQRGGADDAAA